MKTKMIFSTETNDKVYWINLPFIPKMHERFNVKDVLKPGEITEIKQSARSWSTYEGTIESVEYRFNGNDFCPEVFIWCED